MILLKVLKKIELKILNPKEYKSLETLLSNISKVLIQTNFPTLLNMVRQVGLDTFETRKQQALEELGIKETIDELTNLTDQKSIEELKQKLCPTPDVLESSYSTKEWYN